MDFDFEAYKTIEELREAAVKADLKLSVSRLKAQFRMKPKPDAQPAGQYKSAEFGKKYDVYRLSDCVPLKALKASGQPTEKQRVARKIAAIKAKLRSKLAITGDWAERCLADSCVLDTETSGLGELDQIIEIAIVNSAGVTLLNARVQPSVLISPEAQEVHGISMETLHSAPQWPEIANTVRDILSRQPVVIFNSEFDLRLLAQTERAFGRDPAWIGKLDSRCAMRLAASAFGYDRGRISLSNAVMEAGINFSGPAHSALADTVTTLALVNHIAGYRRELLLQLQQLEELISA